MACAMRRDNDGRQQLALADCVGAGGARATTKYSMNPASQLALGSALRDPAVVEAVRSSRGDDLRRGLAALAGDFAFGQHRDDGTAVVAVDRFAIRSACYRVDGDRFSFASRADDLAQPGEEIDVQAIYDYLYHHVIPSPRTIYRNVKRLPPGHQAVWDGKRLTVTPYWTPKFEPPRGGVSFAALKSEFREIVRQSVADRLDGGRAGCFLSGGTDSSTVAGMIREVTGQGAASYSIGFDAQGYDEMEYARIAARHFGTDHHEYYVTPEDLIASMGAVARHYDQPFGNSSAVPAYYCAKMARQDGVTRILAGDGGDELFGGNTRYAKQRVFGVYDHVPGPLRQTLEAVLNLPGVGRAPVLRKGKSYVEQARLPMPERLQTYNLLERLGVTRVLTQGFLAQVDQGRPLADQRDVWGQAAAGTLLDRQLAFDWRYTLAENDLPKVCGTTSMAGLEVAFPLLDHRLVDFSLTLPTSYKLKGLKLRWFFKEALRGFLPDEIITKQKHGFGLPFGAWAHSHAGLNRAVRDTLGSLAERGIAQPVFIRELLDRYLGEHPGYYGEMIWILAMLEHWLQGHSPDFRLEA